MRIGGIVTGRRHGTAAAAGLLLAAAATLGACRDRTLPITVFTGEWAPYTTQHADDLSAGAGGAYGLAADVTTAALREMGNEPIYEFRSWAMVESLVRAKKIEAAFPFIEAEGRRDAFCYSAPLLHAEGRLYYNAERQGPGLALDEAEGVLGVVEGYEYDPELTGRFDDRKVLGSESAAFAALLDGEVDFVPAMVEVAERLLDREQAATRHRLAMVEGARWRPSLHLVVPSRGPVGQPGRCDIELLRRFDAALAQLKESGVHDELLARYQPPQGGAVKVVLRPTERHPLVLAAETPDVDLADTGTPKLLIPAGSRAVVIEWGERFTQPTPFDTSDPYAPRTRVRLLDGPAAGRLVWVPDLFITLEAGTGP